MQKYKTKSCKWLNWNLWFPFCFQLRRRAKRPTPLETFWLRGGRWFRSETKSVPCLTDPDGPWPLTSADDLWPLTLSRRIETTETEWRWGNSGTSWWFLPVIQTLTWNRDEWRFLHRWRSDVRSELPVWSGDLWPVTWSCSKAAPQRRSLPIETNLYFYIRKDFILLFSCSSFCWLLFVKHWHWLPSAK